MKKMIVALVLALLCASCSSEKAQQPQKETNEIIQPQETTEIQQPQETTEPPRENTVGSVNLREYEYRIVDRMLFRGKGENMIYITDILEQNIETWSQSILCDSREGLFLLNEENSKTMITSQKVIDFAITESKIYYLTECGIYAYDLHSNELIQEGQYFDICATEEYLFYLAKSDMKFEHSSLGIERDVGEVFMLDLEHATSQSLNIHTTQIAAIDENLIYYDYEAYALMSRSSGSDCENVLIDMVLLEDFRVFGREIFLLENRQISRYSYELGTKTVLAEFWPRLLIITSDEVFFETDMFLELEGEDVNGIFAVDYDGNGLRTQET